MEPQLTHDTSVRTVNAVEFLTKLMEVDGEKVKAQIWDTAGQERYANMLGTYYKKVRQSARSFFSGYIHSLVQAKGAILVYDLSDRQSFDALDRWRTQLLQHADQNVVIMLVGNK
jgi:small GTP-binding protein